MDGTYTRRDIHSKGHTRRDRHTRRETRRDIHTEGIYDIHHGRVIHTEV